MKLTLVFPPPSENYSEVIWSDKEVPNPPQTAPTILGTYVQKHASAPIDVLCIPTQTVERGIARYFNLTEITTLCQGSDIVGLTCLYNNQESAIELACLIKKENPSATIVLGGQNVSSKHMARLILNQVPEIDYIVIGSGEEALLSIVEQRPPSTCPNLTFRNANGEIQFTKKKLVDLNELPSWNYDNTLGANDLLESYDARTELYAQNTRKYQGRTLGEIGVFSRKGCPKIDGEIGNKKGPCAFCTSAREISCLMSPENFWRQIEILNRRYGIQDFFIADNVFGVTIERLTSFVKARHLFNIPKDVRFRAYTYPEIINSKDGVEIIHLLRKVGISNIFLGVETFNPEISQRANKDPVPFSLVDQAIKRLTQAGMDVFISIMPGLPGESKKTLEHNLDCLKMLLKTYGSKTYERGHLTRVDISPAMPIVGTAWFHALQNDNSVCNKYFQQTGRKLETELHPDFDLLRALSLERDHADITEKDIQISALKAKKMCLQYLKSEMIGGFDLRTTDLD